MLLYTNLNYISKRIKTHMNNKIRLMKDTSIFVQKQIQTQKQDQRKQRRKRLDQDGRNFICSCGKSYLSYPALYTHVKTKHNGQLPTQAILPPTNPIQTPTNKSTPYQTFLKFLQSQFHTSKSQQFINLFEKSFNFTMNDRNYINRLERLVEMEEKRQRELIKVRENINQDLIDQDDDEQQQQPNQSQFIQNQSQHKQQQHHEDEQKSSSPIKNHQQQVLNPQSPKTQQKIPRNQSNVSYFNGLSSQAMRKLYTSSQNSLLSRFQLPQFQLGHTTKQLYTYPQVSFSSIDFLLGKFLSCHQFVEPSLSIVSYFVIKIHDYFVDKYDQQYTQKTHYTKLIQQVNQIVEKLIQADHVYLKQPVIVCKVVFYFCRWMWAAGYTNSFVNWNQVKAD